MGAAEDRLRQVIEPYVTAEGIELDDLEVLGQGSRSIVRVTVDGEEPVHIDHIARLSRGIGRLLDESDPFPGAYTLEVSSPGLERRLRTRRHYEKSLGREVKVKTFGPVDDAKSHRGVLEDVGDEDFAVSVDGVPRRIRFDEVSSAATVFTWQTGGKPGPRRDGRKGTS